MNDLGAQDIDFIQNIVDDLETLHELCTSGRQVASELRHVSVIVRRLILDNELQKAASLVDHRPHLMLSPELQPRHEYQNNQILIAHTAMGMIGGGYHHGFSSDAGCMYWDVREDVGLMACKIDAFRKQKVIFYHGTYITRADILRYAANKMGGAHHGTRKVKNEDIISKAIGAFVFKPIEDEKFSIGVELTRLLNVHEETFPNKDAVNLVHLEVLSSARLISHCPNIRTLKTELEKAIA